MTVKKPLVVLVTGVSCSGKTSIAGHLRTLGHETISLDGYPSLCSGCGLYAHASSRPAR